ncbi:heat shock protein SSB [Apiospora marii]|uniref:heat shock protein SSB n=1 Tax=Apiospora marii TaxID=335849 RepID=UPI00312D0143
MTDQLARVWPIGIDIGTSHIRAAVYRETDQGSWKGDLIPDEDGNTSLSSHLAFSDKTTARLFGERARVSAAKNAGKTVCGVKRFIGYYVSSKEWEAFAFKVINDPRGRGSPSLVLEVGNEKRIFSPLEVMAMLLAQVRRNAMAYLGPYGFRAMVNVPSCFTHEQRSMVQDATEAAGFGVIRLVPTPYGILATRTIEQLRQHEKPLTKVLAIDIGAGFANIAIATMVQGAFHMDVTESARFGGNDLDSVLWHHLKAQAKRQGLDMHNGPGKRRARQRLLTACETAKRALSDMSQTEVLIENFWAGQDFRAVVTRQEFDRICSNRFQSITSALERALSSAKLGRKQIDEVIASGGTYRIPKIRKMLDGFFRGCPSIRYLNQDETEVTGMAYMASLLFDDPKTNLRHMPHALAATVVTPWSIGISTGDEKMTPILPRHSNLPTEQIISITWDPHGKCPRIAGSWPSLAATTGLRRKPGPAPVHVFEGDQDKATDNAWLGTIDIESLLPDIINCEFKIQVAVRIGQFHPIVRFREEISGRTIVRELNQMGRLPKYQVANMVANEQRYHHTDVAEVDRVRTRASLDEQIGKLQLEVQNMSSPPAPAASLDRIDAMQAWLDSEQSAPIESYNMLQGELTELRQAIQRLVISHSGVPAVSPKPTDFGVNKHPPVPKWPSIDMSRKGPLPAMCEDALTTDEVIEGSVIYATRARNPLCTPPIVDPVPEGTDSSKIAREPLLRKSAAEEETVAQVIEPPELPSDSLSDLLDKETIRPQQPAPNGAQPRRSHVGPGVSGQSRHSSPQVASGQIKESLAATPVLARSEVAPPVQPGIANGTTRATAVTNASSLDFNARLPKPHQVPTTPYTDMDFERISTYLRASKQEGWSTVPRLFTVLTLINCTDALNIFMQNGMSDMWFPFDTDTLPPVLQSSTKARFLEIQKVVYENSKAHQLESGAKPHAFFDKDDHIPFVSKMKMGRGAHGTVDKVISTESTYASVKFFAMILSPAGDCNLDEYYVMAGSDPNKVSMIRSFYGCLAKAVQYLHDRQIRHRDIKPQNIIVKDDEVYLADFGIAYSWEDLTGGTTTADSGKTRMYAAPEVMQSQPRNEAADIWSLGCVFFEMATVIKGRTVADLRDTHFLPRTESRFFCHNVEHLAAWAESLRAHGHPEDDMAFGWARRMLQEQPGKRPTARSLCNFIAEESAACGLMFCGTCCGDGFETVTDLGEEQDPLWDF